jgi:hypothetical protein
VTYLGLESYYNSTSQQCEAYVSCSDSQNLNITTNTCIDQSTGFSSNNSSGISSDDSSNSTNSSSNSINSTSAVVVCVNGYYDTTYGMCICSAGWYDTPGSIY